MVLINYLEVFGFGIPYPLKLVRVWTSLITADKCRIKQLSFDASIVAQYADGGHESAPNWVRFGSGPVPGRHLILGGGIGGLRQLGAEPAH